MINKVEGIITDSAREDFPKYEYIESRFNWDDDDFGYRGYGHYGLCGLGCRSAYGKDYIYPKSTIGKIPLTTKEWEDPDLEGVPSEIGEYYSELLELYSPEELDALRLEYGDNIVKTLFESEVGHCSPAGYSDEYGNFEMGAT